MKVLAVYPGRFQPLHKGHAQVYEWLKNKFGDAVIATSDKVDPPKSPFNFKEKVQIMKLAGIPSSDVQQVRNPYIASEILRNYDGKKTVLVFAVSQKDMEEDPRFSFKPTKSGKPGYLQPYPKDGRGLKPFGDPDKPVGYVIVTPTFNFDVLGEPMKSATEVRKQFSEANYDKQAKIIKDLFGSYSKQVHNLMNKKIAGTGKPKTIKQIRVMKEEHLDSIGELDHKKFGPMLDSFVQFASKKLGIKSRPTHELKKDEMETSFAAYNPGEKHMIVVTKNRHPMDIFRSVAHELVHHKQNEDGRLGKDISKEGATGSDIENEANSEAGKIMRWFAKANPALFRSGYVVEGFQLDEGLYDPSAFKAVFLAGGPGSGKDYVMKQTLHGHGLTEINSDVAFEFLMRKQGLDFKMPDEEQEQRDKARGRAKNITKEKQRLALAGRRGVIINGTADDPEKIISIRKMLEDNGYDSMMVFVDTNNEVSRERNIDRGRQGGREVPEDIRQEKWQAAQDAKPVLEKLFGKKNFMAIDNSNDLRTAPKEVVDRVNGEFMKIYKKTKNFVNEQPVNTEKAIEWRKAEIQKRNIQSFVPVRATKYGPGSVARGPEPEPQAPLAQAAQQQQAAPAPTRNQQSSKIMSAQSPEELSQAQQLGLQYYGFGRYGKTVKGKHTVTHLSQDGQLVPKQDMTMVSEDLRKWFREKWVRFDTKGNIKGDCAREPGEGKPKCQPMAAALAMSKQERAKSARRKRREDPVANRSGKGNKPINVKTESVQKAIDKINRDRMSEEILLEKNIPTNPELWSKAKSLAKSKFDVYPSAYANGWAAKWYKSKGGGWKSQADESFEMFIEGNTPSDREWGTNSLTNLYKEGTPGQTPLKKLKKKVEENILGKEPGNDGPGDTFGVIRSPSGLGMGYSISESLDKWMNDEKTIERFITKYGTLAEQKLIDTANSLSKITENSRLQPRHLSQIRESWEAKGGRDMGTVANQGKEEIDEEDVIKPTKSLKGYKKHIHPESTFEKKALNERGEDSEGLYRSTESGAGLTRKGAKKFGVKTAVTTPPSKLDPEGKAAKRRKSFCARMGGMPGPMKDEKGRPTRKAMSLRRWNCEE